MDAAITQILIYVIGTALVGIVVDHLRVRAELSALRLHVSETYFKEAQGKEIMNKLNDLIVAVKVIEERSRSIPAVQHQSAANQ